MTTPKTLHMDRLAAAVKRLLTSRSRKDEDRGVALAEQFGNCVWVADDGNAEVEYDYTDTGREVAEAYVADGDWGSRTETDWITVYVFRRWYFGSVVVDHLDERESHTVRLEAEAPKCRDEDGDVHADHEWGEDSDPRGSGGGVRWHATCVRCGLVRHENTWAQDRATGRQGLHQTRYELAGG